jgi:hypothetical protein
MGIVIVTKLVYNISNTKKHMSPEKNESQQAPRRNPEQRRQEIDGHMTDIVDQAHRLSANALRLSAGGLPMVREQLLRQARDASDEAAKMPQRTLEQRVTRLHTLIRTNKVELNVLNALDDKNIGRIDDLLNALPIYKAELKELEGLQKNATANAIDIKELPAHSTLLNAGTKDASIDGVPTSICISPESFEVNKNTYRMKYRARLANVSVMIKEAMWLGGEKGIQLTGSALGNEERQELPPDILLPILRQMKNGDPVIDVSKKVFLEKK